MLLNAQQDRSRPLQGLEQPKSHGMELIGVHLFHHQLTQAKLHHA